MEIQGPLPANIHLHFVPSLVPFSNLKPLEYAGRVRILLERLRRQGTIDLIHQLNPVELGLSALLTGTHIPLILGLFVPSWPDHAEISDRLSLPRKLVVGCSGWLMKQLDRHEQRHARAFLLSTPAAASRLYDPANAKDRIHVLPYGIDADCYAPVDPENWSSQEPTILYLAHLSRRKGIFTLLEAFPKVARELPNAGLTIAGSGSEAGAVRNLIDQMACRDRITLLGSIDRPQVSRTMQQCTVYCLPSYGEPFGMSALEAMACGKPVVGTDAGGLAYLITDPGGRKVPPGDADALAQALIEILTSPDLQRQMGRFNRQQVEEIYSWERVIDRLELLYYSVC